VAPKKGLILTIFLCLPALVVTAGADPEEKMLGDESDGSRAHPIHLIPLMTEEGDKIAPDDDPLLPFSTSKTCGECHSYATVTKGWHFNAVDSEAGTGRVGQPWILVDARTGIQIPISYRRWPGTFTPEQVGLTRRLFLRIFGRHTPGGGIGERPSEDPSEIMRSMVSGNLEANCLSCHDGDPGHDQGEYDAQVIRENFRWAAAATCSFASVTGSAKDMPDTYDPIMPEPPEDPKLVPPGITYRANTFDGEKRVSLNIQREVPAERCYFCHSNLYLDGDDAEKWSSDEDIHLKAGLTCVDCHRNGIDHNIIRGYEGEADVSTNRLAASSSCRGCHLAGESSSAPTAGRLGAPVPEHVGMPTVHFEKLGCTACHSGPWPGDKTYLTKTSMAHRLGTLNVNKSHEALPHIAAPVFAQQPDGKIAPHKLIWPAFWADMKDANITPIPFEAVRRTIGKVLAKQELPASGDWPALTTEDITEALKGLSAEQSIEGKGAYISGGSLYSLDDSGQLKKEENHPAAEPYLWPIAHDVRPAAQSLGIRYCTDCHATDAPFFFGDVSIDSPIVAARGSVKMVDFQGDIDAFYTKVFAFSFVFRPWMKVIALGSCVVIGAVLLLYALKALACVAKVLAGQD